MHRRGKASQRAGARIPEKKDKACPGRDAPGRPETTGRGNFEDRQGVALGKEERVGMVC